MAEGPRGDQHACEEIGDETMNKPHDRNQTDNIPLIGPHNSTVRFQTLAVGAAGPARREMAFRKHLVGRSRGPRYCQTPQVSIRRRAGTRDGGGGSS